MLDSSTAQLRHGVDGASIADADPTYRTEYATPLLESDSSGTATFVIRLKSMYSECPLCPSDGQYDQYTWDYQQYTSGSVVLTVAKGADYVLSYDIRNNGYTGLPTTFTEVYVSSGNGPEWKVYTKNSVPSSYADIASSPLLGMLSVLPLYSQGLIPRLPGLEYTAAWYETGGRTLPVGAIPSAQTWRIDRWIISTIIYSQFPPPFILVFC